MKAVILHIAVIAALAGLVMVLPTYHLDVFSRVLVLAVFAMGYNLMFGYVGLLSLGHAMFFAVGVYGAGLTMQLQGWSAPLGLAAGILAGAALAGAVGLLALRTAGVAFMIVTMMFAQVFYLATLYFSEWTRGDEGFVMPQAARVVNFAGLHFNLSDPVTRYTAALGLFAIVLLITFALVRSAFGRVLVAIRENEERTRMLGYDTFSNKLVAVTLSGAIAAAAGAAYAILFGYAGATFASVQYSILPLLWVLVGGAGTTLGPLIGTLAMFYLIDYSSSYLSRELPGWNLSYLGVVGIALIVLVLFFPKGLLGALRQRWLKWLP